MTKNPRWSGDCLLNLYEAHCKLQKQVHISHGDAKRILVKTLEELDKKLLDILESTEKSPEKCPTSGDFRCEDCPRHKLAKELLP